MDQYTVTGMSCAACQARVEKAVSRVPGVTGCSVSLLTNSMGVEGTAESTDIIKAVENAGYGAVKRGGSTTGSTAAQGGSNLTNIVEASSVSSLYAEQEEALRDRETPKLRKRLIASVIFLLILMYYSMGHMMWHWPVIFPIFHNHVALATFEMLLTIIIMIFNGRFFTSGAKSLIHGAPNMDTLVMLGSSAAFGYSVVILFLMISAQGTGDKEMVDMYAMDLYFESAAMILTLITVGKLLEAKSKGRTTNALKSLMKLSPQTATVLRDDEEKTIPVSQVRIGDIFIVKPGESIPVDGVILSGATAVNESALTGESIPVDKAEGDTVSAATINTVGYIKCTATRVGQDTTLSQIIRMVSDAAATKAPLARIADKVSGIFVPAVIIIAVLTFGGWLIAGKTVSFAIARAISVLVISCPCALGLATPVAIMVGNGVGARHGILYKTAEALEVTGRARTVILDKTGTITKGEPSVTDIIPADGVTEEELLRIAISLEKRSEHPLARAITNYADTLDLPIAASGETDGYRELEISDFKAFPGNGLSASYDGRVIYGGNEAFISKNCALTPDLENKAVLLAGEGKTPLFFAEDKTPLGIIAVADTLKSDSKEAISDLKKLGVKTIMLTGDNERTAEAIGRLSGVDEVIAGVLPEGKEKVVAEQLESGKVIMVGDGINDAPALTRADVGIAIGAGADVAVDAADVVLMKSVLTDVVSGIELSRATIRNIHENLFWAFVYNIICIPMAMGLFGFALKPMYGALAMSLSSFSVCMNALRLNLVKLRSDRKRTSGEDDGSCEAGDIGIEDTEISSCDDKDDIKHDKDNEEDTMLFSRDKGDKTVIIEGMMCEHCEATVRKSLEAISGVKEAKVSHKKGTAVLKLSGKVNDADIRQAIEEKDYKVVEIR